MTKRLLKSRSNRIVFGVCGGIADYFNVDPAIVRLAAILLAFCTQGIGLAVVYVLCAFILPEA